MTLLDWFLLFHFTSPVLLWLGFYMVFHVWADQTNSKQYSLPYYVVGISAMLIDFYVDVTIGTLLFMQWPNVSRLMLSTRMDDLIRNGMGWRKALAVQIVGRLLEPYDLSVPKQHNTYGLFK